MTTRILLAGTHRCGSTWVANVLRQAPELSAVYELDCHRTGVVGKVSSRHLGEYPVLRPSDRSFWYATVWDLAFNGGWPWETPRVLKRPGSGVVRAMPKPARDYGVGVLARGIATLRRSPHQVIVKSADCAFTLEWIAQRYAPQIVVQRRDPMNILSSWMALGIEGDTTLAANPLIRSLWLEPHGFPEPRDEDSRVAVAAWTIGVLLGALKATVERHPEWTVISYDELCTDPMAGFAALFKKVHLPWTDEIATYVAASTDLDFIDPVRNPRQIASEHRKRPQPSDTQRDRQATQYPPRLSEEEIAEAHAVLDSFHLGSWGYRP